ncbi:MAG: hypothetical protein V4664_01000 [Patescibacteria group bacterium]
MDHPILSVEYCHVTLGQDYSHEVKNSNEIVGPIIEAFKDRYKIVPYVMIDDLRTSEKVTEEYIQRLVESLDVKPVSIYLESSFIELAESVLEAFEHDNHHMVTTDEERWLHQIKDKYGSKTNFLLSWKSKETGNEERPVNFSCSTLVAASYLFRLGHLGLNTISPVYGKKVHGEKLLNILASSYMQTETNTRTIVNTYRPGTTDDIMTLFY